MPVLHAVHVGVTIAAAPVDRDIGRDPGTSLPTRPLLAFAQLAATTIAGRGIETPRLIETTFPCVPGTVKR